ncbi:hypothetical protein [Halomonas alimentaria]|uniref:Uncharacterized protein n=1 Tax=Halomonas alimentaria TaxID=147248 RepID=A0A7X4W6K3_9GAMM|nr:hypothetical protein [Halomonas alimentaria]NAW35003.1 hypothetical protein [Halomonas alimentaria]
MHIVYTARATGFKPGISYRNPQFFHSPEHGVTSVEIEDGEWPEIVKAYEAAGIEVTSDKPKKAKRKKAEPKPDLSEESEG